MHFCMLHEKARIYILLHLISGHEVIVHAGLLPCSRLSRGVRHRESELTRELCHQLLYQRRLAHTAGTCDHTCATLE